MTITNKQTYSSTISNGSKFTFSINSLLKSDFKVIVDSIVLVDGIDYSLTLSGPISTGKYTIYTSCELELKKSLTNQLLTVITTTDISQDLKYSNQRYLDTVALEGSLDKLTLLIQQLRDRFIRSLTHIDAFNDLDFNLVDPNVLMVTDGRGKVIFSYKLPVATPQDVGKVLALTQGLNALTFINPLEGKGEVPDPTSLTTPKLLYADSSGYKFWTTLALPTQSDDGKLLRYRVNSTGEVTLESVFVPGINNPPIPNVSSDTTELMLASREGSAYWTNKNYLKYPQTTGVVLGFNAELIDPTHINVNGGIVIALKLEQNSPSDFFEMFVAGLNNIPIDPTTTSSKILYLHLTVDPPSKYSYSIDGSTSTSPGDNKLLLASIECVNIEGVGSIIATIKPRFTVVTFLAHQLSQLLNIQSFGSKYNSTCKLTPNGDDQISLSSGIFSGYCVNGFDDVLNPHVKTIDEKLVCDFRFVFPDGQEQQVKNTLAGTDIKIMTGTGNGTVVISSTDVTYYPIWINQDGRIKLQYTNLKWAKTTEPTLDSILQKIEDPVTLAEAYYKIAIIRCTTDGNFSSSTAADKWVITPLNNKVINSALGINGEFELPTVIPSNQNKFLQQTLTSWKESTYELPANLTPSDRGFPIVVNPTNTGLEVGKFAPIVQSDIYASALLNNGVLSGFTATVNNDNISISVAPGQLLFTSNESGIPTSVELVELTTATNVAIANSTQSRLIYVSINKAKLFTFTTEEPEYIRGDTLLLYRVQFNTTRWVIENIKARFTPLSAVQRRIRNIYKMLKNTTDGIFLQTDGTNSLKYTAGIMRGFNVNPDDNLNSDEIVLSEASIYFQFRSSTGADSNTQTTFPDIPQYESPPGTLVDVPTDNVAIYPVWLYSTREVVIQYATELYTNSTLIDISEWLFALKRDTDANINGALIGAVVWQVGSNFNNDCYVVNIAGDKVNSSGGSPLQTLPQSTVVDVDKVLQVDLNGNPNYGIIIARSTDGSSDNKLVQYNVDSTRLDPVSIDDLTFPSLVGTTDTHVVASLDGRLKPLRNGDKYPYPTLWNLYELMFCSVEPPSKRVVRIAVELKLFAPLDYTGLRSLAVHGTDFFTSVERLVLPEKTTPPFNLLDSNGQITTDIPINLFTNTNNNTLPKPNSTLVTYGGRSLIDSTTDLLVHTPTGSDYHLDYTTTFDFKVKKVSSKYNPHVHCWGGCFFDITKLKTLASAFDLSITSQVLTNNPTYTTTIYSTSGTPTTPLTTSQISEYKTKITSVDQNYYHSQAVPLPQNNRIGTTFLISPIGEDVVENEINLRISIAATIPSSATNVSPLIKSSRFEYKTLSGLNSLAEGNGIVLGDNMPNLVPGNILVIYYIGAVGNYLVKTKSDYKPELTGIALNPFRFSTKNAFPMITLEQPNGANPPINVKQSTFIGCSNPMYAVYRFDNVTQTEFDSYNICCYIRSTQPDIIAKATLLEAQLGFVNIAG